MEQNILQKPQKSKFWVVVNIWSYIITYSVVIGIIWRIFAWSLSRFLSNNILIILDWLAVGIILVYASKMAIKIVLNKTIIPKKDIMNVSIGLTIVLIIIQVIVTIIYKLFSFGHIGELILIDVLLFSSSYYWLKKYIL
jgi:hypothetical protein